MLFSNCHPRCKFGSKWIRENAGNRLYINFGTASPLGSFWRLESKRATIRRVKYWEIIADHLSKAGWSYGCVAAVDCEGRTIWIADAHRDDGKRFVVSADEKLTAFVELESAVRGCGE
jgi:hypothetical protein